MLDELAQFSRMIATSMQVNRMNAYGWEEIVSDLNSDRLRELAKHLPHAADALLIAADMKEPHGTA